MYLVDITGTKFIKQVNGKFYGLGEDGKWYYCNYMELPSEKPNKEFRVRFKLDKTKPLEDEN